MDINQFKKVELKKTNKTNHMATVINNPGGTSEGSGMGVVIGVILAIIVIGLFLIYGLPKMRGNTSPSNVDVNVQLPSGNNGGTGTPQ